MYTDLREFDLAKKYMTTANQDVKELIAKQADWAMNTNDPVVAWYVAFFCDFNGALWDDLSCCSYISGSCYRLLLLRLCVKVVVTRLCWRL